MQAKFKTAILDTSCIILLNKIDELLIIKKLFETVLSSKEVAHEFKKPMPSWIKIKNPQNKNYQKLLAVEADIGEASVVALALETKHSILVLDDLKARKLAGKLSLDYTGTFGLLLAAKKYRLMDAVKPFLDKINKTNFRFSKSVIEIILKEANE